MRLWRRRRQEQAAPQVVLPSLDRLAGLIERVVELVDEVAGGRAASGSNNAPAPVPPAAPPPVPSQEPAPPELPVPVVDVPESFLLVANLMSCGSEQPASASGAISIMGRTLVEKCWGVFMAGKWRAHIVPGQQRTPTTSCFFASRKYARAKQFD